MKSKSNERKKYREWKEAASLIIAFVSLGISIIAIMISSRMERDFQEFQKKSLPLNYQVTVSTMEGVTDGTTIKSDNYPKINLTGISASLGLNKKEVCGDYHAISIVEIKNEDMMLNENLSTRNIDSRYIDVSSIGHISQTDSKISFDEVKFIFSKEDKNANNLTMNINITDSTKKYFKYYITLIGYGEGLQTFLLHISMLDDVTKAYVMESRDVYNSEKIEEAISEMKLNVRHDDFSELVAKEIEVAQNTVLK